jgi:hypothetical protein
MAREIEGDEVLTEEEEQAIWDSIDALGSGPSSSECYEPRPIPAVVAYQVRQPKEKNKKTILESVPRAGEIIWKFGYNILPPLLIDTLLVDRMNGGSKNTGVLMVRQSFGWDSSNGICRLSIRRIAKLTSMSPSSALRAVNELKERGYLKVLGYDEKSEAVIYWIGLPDWAKAIYDAAPEFEKYVEAIREHNGLKRCI